MRDVQARTLRLFTTDGVTVGFLLLAAVVLFTALDGVFLSSQNIQNILIQSTFVMVIACGMTFVLITGGVDLSVGSLLGLSAGVSVYVLVSGGPMLLAVLAALAVGLLVGALNGFLVAKVGVNDFIVTLATLGMAGGALQLLVSAKALRGFESSSFSALANNSIIGIPVPVVIAAVTVLVLEFVLRRTIFGRMVFAVGINREAAFLSGIDVVRVRMGVFMLSGLLAAVAGVLMASRLSSVPAGLGSGYELQAISAAVLAGTSLFGGRGSVARTALGALLLGAVNTGLQIQQVDSAWFTIIVGVSIVAAMALDRAVRDFAMARLGLQTRRDSIQGPPELGLATAGTKGD
jgi:ribose/xylose/arabinose/galactoside ABC-type transport system permease subunit